MKRLQGYGAWVECDRAVKGPDSILCYTGDTLVLSCRGVTEFDAYVLTDKNGKPVEWDTPELEAKEEVPAAEPTTMERLEALESAVLTMIMGGAAEMFDFIRLQAIMNRIGAAEVNDFCAKGMLSEQQRKDILVEIGE